jgi:hypothetical protein
MNFDDPIIVTVPPVCVWVLVLQIDSFRGEPVVDSPCGPFTPLPSPRLRLA